MRSSLGFILLLFSGSLMLFEGLQLFIEGQVQIWLLLVIVQYFGLASPFLHDIERIVYLLPTIFLVAGVIIIVGTIIWFSGPKRPHRAAEFIMVMGKITIALGASIATIPIAMMLFGIWVTIILGSAGFSIEWLLYVLPHLGFQLSSLFITCLGSVLIVKH